MGVDVTLYAIGAVSDEDLEAATARLRERLGKWFLASMWAHWAGPDGDAYRRAWVDRISS